MRWAKLVLAVVLAVGWTSAASAECAWVLWRYLTLHDINIPLTGTSEWYVQNGHPTHGECTTERDRKFRHHAAGVRVDPGTKDFTQNPSNAGLAFTRQGQRQTSTYSCLPDTIDPRKKK